MLLGLVHAVAGHWIALASGAAAGQLGREIVAKVSAGFVKAKADYAKVKAAVKALEAQAKI